MTESYIFGHRTPVVPYGAETCAAHDGGVLYGGELSATPTDGKYSAGACAAGMGLYGIMPIGGFYIGAGGCAGASNGGCGTSCGGSAGCGTVSDEFTL